MNTDDDHVEAGLLSLRRAVRSRQLERFVAQEERLGLAQGDAKLFRRAMVLIEGGRALAQALERDQACASANSSRARAGA
jgi:hypothetical protein